MVKEKSKDNNWLQSKAKAVEGFLESEEYCKNELELIDERLEEIDAILETGCVRGISPDHPISDGSNGGSNRSKHEMLILHKCNLEEKRRKIESRKEKIEFIYTSLSLTERKYLELRFKENRTLEEIGEVMHASRETVRREINRILQSVDIF